MKKNDTIKRVKFIARQTKGYAKMVGRLINDVMHPAIKSKEEVLEKLTTTPSVEDIVKIFNELHNKVVPSLEMGVDYKVYNQENKYGHSIIYFFDNENDELPEDELSKVWDILNNEKEAHISDLVLVINTYAGPQYFIWLAEGKNGSGDFVDDDMKLVVRFLDRLKENGVAWRSVTSLNNDIPDDLSDWIITFTFKDLEKDGEVEQQ